MNPLEWIAAAALFLAVPGTVELCMLTGAALLPRRRTAGTRPAPPLPLAVVVPAHNEEAGIGDAVASLLAATPPAGGLDLIVVADNCTDGTADAARAAGARVLERADPTRRGKGYALDLGFQAALARGAAAIAVVDADSRVSANLWLELERAFGQGADGVQVAYTAPEEPAAPPGRRLAALALHGFNVVRPRGRSRLGLSAGIFGNGFALSARWLRSHPYGAVSVVEDLEYHLELVRRGGRVEFVEAARVVAPLPQSSAGEHTQRTRWEGGRLGMAARQLPALLPAAIARPRLLEPALDLLLLPLGYHVLWFLPALAFGPPWARWAALIGLAVVAWHLAVTWIQKGAHWKDLGALVAAPWYVARKLWRIPATLATARRGAAWRRTERDPSAGSRKDRPAP